MTALIPYISTSTFEVFGIKLHLFGPLVALGLILGRRRLLNYAARMNLDEELVSDYVVWMALPAFIVSHWVEAFLYFPGKVAANPMVLLEIWNGLSSMGGFFGAALGGVFYLRVVCKRRPVGAQPVLVFADGSTYALLLGWCFGRLGCSIVHDHPGKVVPEGTFGAVGPWPDGLWRYDLGLVELGFAIVLFVVITFATKWDKWPPGRMVGVVLVIYTPFRLMLDFLRTEDAVPGGLAIPDARYAGLTPAQWFCFAFLALGVWLLFVRKPKAEDLAYAKDDERKKREAKKRLEEQGKQAEDDSEDDEDEDDSQDDDSQDGDSAH